MNPILNAVATPVLQRLEGLLAGRPFLLLGLHLLEGFLAIPSAPAPVVTPPAPAPAPADSKPAA